MTQAPVAIPAQSALAVASLAVQGFADVETLGGSAPDFALRPDHRAVGRAQEFLRRPVPGRPFAPSSASRPRSGATTWRVDNAQALWKGERERILAEAKKGKGEKRVAARADLDAMGHEPAAPPSPDRTVTEPTFEGLTKLFAEGQPSLGIFSDEGGQFLGGHAMSSDNRTKDTRGPQQALAGRPHPADAGR